MSLPRDSLGFPLEESRIVIYRTGTRNPIKSHQVKLYFLHTFTDRTPVPDYTIIFCNHIFISWRFVWHGMVILPRCWGCVNTALWCFYYWQPAIMVASRRHYSAAKSVGEIFNYMLLGEYTSYGLFYLCKTKKISRLYCALDHARLWVLSREEISRFSMLVLKILMLIYKRICLILHLVSPALTAV